MLDRETQVQSWTVASMPVFVNSFKCPQPGLLRVRAQTAVRSTIRSWLEEGLEFTPRFLVPTHRLKATALWDTTLQAFRIEYSSIDQQNYVLTNTIPRHWEHSYVRIGKSSLEFASHP